MPAVPIGDVIREVMSQTDNSQFALRRGCVPRSPTTPTSPHRSSSGPAGSSGRAVTHAQWVLAAREDVTDLLFSGVTSLQGVARSTHGRATSRRNGWRSRARCSGVVILH